MNRFAFARATTIAEVALAASTTVADAMTSAGGAADAGETCVVKAGGVDLLDLMKENLLAPGSLVSLRDAP